MTIYDKKYQIKQQILINDIMQHYGLLGRAKTCPFHLDKENRFSYTNNRFMCHSTQCGAHGDVIDFVMLYEGLNYIAAIEHLNAIYGVYDDSQPLSVFDNAFICFQKLERALKQAQNVPECSAIWLELEPERQNEHKQAVEKVRQAEQNYNTAMAQLLQYFKPVYALHHYLRSQGVYVNLFTYNVRIYKIGDTLLNWGYIKIKDCREIISKYKAE